MIYVDTSVLLPAYVPEPRSEDADRILKRTAGVVISDLCVAEFGVALARKQRAGELSREQAAAARDAFARHIASGLIRRIHLNGNHFDRTGELSERSSVTVRTLDAVHLVVAGDAGLGIATFDDRMAQAAKALGIRVLS